MHNMKAPHPNCLLPTLTRPHLYYLLPILVCLTLSCTTPRTKFPAIRDFSPSLQPALISAVATSVAGYDTGATYIRHHATDSELALLSRCEHPILRAIALREMTKRPSFDHQKIMLQHLDDTAIVLVDHGEWGDVFRTVSDQMVEEGRWSTEKDRQLVLDEILEHHDYLRSAYTGLEHVDTPEKYYDHIKVMVTRDRPYDQIEYALYALAKCGKKEDIPQIKEILLANTGMAGAASFDIIAAYPDTSYMEVLKHYFWHGFYRRICRERSIYPAVDFISALGCSKDTASARMLEFILAKQPFMPCLVDTSSLKEAVMNAIWNNPCPAYSRLRRQIKWHFDKQKASDTAGLSFIVPITIDSSLITKKDTVPVGWWYTNR